MVRAAGRLPLRGEAESASEEATTGSPSPSATTPSGRPSATLSGIPSGRRGASETYSRASEPRRDRRADHLMDARAGPDRSDAPPPEGGRDRGGGSESEAGAAGSASARARRVTGRFPTSGWSIRSNAARSRRCGSRSTCFGLSTAAAMYARLLQQVHRLDLVLLVRPRRDQLVELIVILEAAQHVPEAPVFPLGVAGRVAERLPLGVVADRDGEPVVVAPAAVARPAARTSRSGCRCAPACGRSVRVPSARSRSTGIADSCSERSMYWPFPVRRR